MCSPLDSLEKVEEVSGHPEQQSAGKEGNTKPSRSSKERKKCEALHTVVVLVPVEAGRLDASEQER